MNVPNALRSILVSGFSPSLNVTVGEFAIVGEPAIVGDLGNLSVAEEAERDMLKASRLFNAASWKWS